MKVQKKGTAFRGDLEGVRGIALVIILFTHLIDWPTGGFVALDAFFVLSGFLITGLLLREYDKSGTISYSGFYRRRIRRLMPSAMLVLVMTTIAAFTIFIGSRALATFWDAIWSLLLVSNWNFALNGTDYFATTLPQSPLLHFWSLSVEEQFYLVWPALVLLLLWLGSRNRQAAKGSALQRRPLIIGLVVIAVASLAWSAYSSNVNPQVAYLSTLTRTWELALGALLCFALPVFKSIPALVRPIMAYAGLASIIATAFIFTPSIHYPGLWALIPVGGTMLIVIAGVGGNSYLWPTTNPVARYLGKISYTSYLWHWPIFILTAAVVGKESPIYLYAAIPVSLLFAALTTRFIEDPIRLSQWLEPKPKHHRRGLLSNADVDRIKKIQIGSAIGIATVALLLVISVFAIPRPASSEALMTISTPSTTEAATAGQTTADAALASLNKQIVAGLDLTAWPSDLDPSLDNLADDLAPQWVNDKCLDVDESNVNNCIYGDASLTKTAVLLGDSTAISYMPGLEPALNKLGYRIHVLTHGECPVANVQVIGQSVDRTPAPGFPGVCDDNRAWSLKQAADLNPDLVILTDGEAEIPSMVIDDNGSARVDAFRAGLVDSLSKLELPKAQVVVLNAPPQSVALASCATRFNAPNDCTKPISSLWYDQLKLDNDAVETANKTRSIPAQVVDTSEWYCSAQSVCPAIAGKTPIRADILHLTAKYAAQLESILSITFSNIVAPATPAAPTSVPAETSATDSAAPAS